MTVIFSVDAESGLYGDAFAVGYTVTDFNGKELESGYFACPFEKAKMTHENREWILVNVIPVLPKETVCANTKELYAKVYALWMRIKSSYETVIAIGDYHYPVETNLFANAIRPVDERQFSGPFPFHEVDTALFVAGIDREDYPRIASELPEHHPVNDARYATRLFLLAMEKTEHLRKKSLKPLP
jgi:hypothetical protein